ncbi:hypothetical protein [Streptomyces sp. NPDC005125]
MLVLVHSGLDREEIRITLRRTSQSVARSIRTLQQQLSTDEAGLVAAAHSLGLLRTPYGPAA